MKLGELNKDYVELNTGKSLGVPTSISELSTNITELMMTLAELASRLDCVLVEDNEPEEEQKVEEYKPMAALTKQIYDMNGDVLHTRSTVQKVLQRLDI